MYHKFLSIVSHYVTWSLMLNCLEIATLLSTNCAICKLNYLMWCSYLILRYDFFFLKAGSTMGRWYLLPWASKRNQSLASAPCPTCCSPRLDFPEETSRGPFPSGQRYVNRKLGNGIGRVRWRGNDYPGTGERHDWLVGTTNQSKLGWPTSR